MIISLSHVNNFSYCYACAVYSYINKCKKFNNIFVLLLYNTIWVHGNIITFEWFILMAHLLHIIVGHMQFIILNI